MQIRITRISVLRTGVIVSVMYGVFALIMLPFAIIGLFSGTSGAVASFLLLLFSPVAALVSGCVSAILFNITSQLLGGLIVDVEKQDPEIDFFDKAIG